MLYQEKAHSIPRLVVVVAALWSRQSPGERSRDGSTPLMSAASSGLEANVVVVQQLLDAKASPSVKNKAGQTALHCACQAVDDRCAMLLLKLGSRADQGSHCDGTAHSA